MSENANARRLVERVVLGELPVDDPQVEQALAGDPSLRAELEETLAARAAVEATAHEERAALLLARDPSLRAPELDVVEVLRRAARSDARRRGRPALLALAAVLLIALLGWWLQRARGSATSIPDVPLSETRLAVVGWVKESGGLRLTWTGRLAPRERFEVRVADGEGRMLAPPVRTSDNACTFPWAAVQQWPRRVRVAIEHLDVTGTTVRRATEAFDLPP